MNILIIPEDFRKDQYILKPIIQAMFNYLNKSTVKVAVCKDPLLQGVSQALKWERIEEIIYRYQWKIDLFLLCIDRDGREGRKESLNNLEQKATEILGNDKLFVAENAWQELEVWILAGHQLPKDWTWLDLRQEINPKENYYLPFATQKNVLKTPDQGRKILAEEAARQYQRIRQLCPEDMLNLETRIRQWLNQ